MAVAVSYGAPRHAGRPSVAEAAAALRAPLPEAPLGVEARNAELIRAASLAPNSHNTQPWRFEASGDRIAVAPDLSRRCPAVDPDDHHLFVSLGCAAETLVVAATAYGLAAEPRVEADGRWIEVTLRDEGVPRSPLVDAVFLRQSTRSTYDGGPLGGDVRSALMEAAVRPGVSARMIDEPAAKARLRDLVLEGHAAQMGDPAFVAELRDWIRFDGPSALARRDGLFAPCTGNPTIPGWLGRRVFPLLVRRPAEARLLARQIDSSSALVVFVGERDRPGDWIETGRAFMRLALTATRLGLAHAHANQAVEVPRVRARLAAELGLGAGRPSLVIRLGRGPARPYSLRRPVAAVT